MKLVVFGAGGGTGRETVAQGLAAGHHVTAVVRRPDALQARPGLQIAVVPDLTRADLVEEAVDGRDVVISALGPNARGPVSVCTDGVRSILDSMTRTGVRRLIVVSAHGAAESNDGSLYSRLLRAMLGHKMRDKDEMESLIRASAVDWTIVRPPALRNTPHTGVYRVGTDLKIGLTSAISRADLADFLLREAASPAHLHQAPRIAA
ncbi:SDR family oxidoreductase [Microbispora corallina]|uniref:NADH-flavin reductase n=1 Tax=Microbispora corallina TaxID=83302 RepID=A0ABQ4GB67_9ACTN|nr:SDR family oxidoreductase [Microbispora corallina]GIH44326.1 NADH-flavin reductase [Microbispora corallina]